MPGMTQAELNREQAAFSEKIALAKLEESKAGERVRELEYQQARFVLDINAAICKQQQAMAAQAANQPIQGRVIDGSSVPPPIA